jgi:heterodisulfide reductase subunit B2
MTYLYYPGCSLMGTAREYDLAARALLINLGVELIEIEDWTCCGATAADGVSRLLALTLSARNLALAEKMDRDLDILAPCSACYLNLKKAGEVCRLDRETKQRVNQALAEEHLYVGEGAHVRHLLDVLTRDMDVSYFRERVDHPLKGLVVAPYYGCQCLRPFLVFDDPERPCSMEPWIKAAGADVYDWDMGGKCCGASHMTTKPEVGRILVRRILEAAIGADVIVTVCPMCQMNLEAYQSAISREAGRDLAMDVLYLPQLLGLALGLAPGQIRLDLNLALKKEFYVKSGI